MDAVETQEMAQKESRGRQPRLIGIYIQLPLPDLASLTQLSLKRMKQLGEDVSRDRIISEAIQLLCRQDSGARGGDANA